MLLLSGEVTVKTEDTNQLECDWDSDTEELLYTKNGSYKDHHLTKFLHYVENKTYQPQLHQRFTKGAPDCPNKTTYLLLVTLYNTNSSPGKSGG